MLHYYPYQHTITNILTMTFLLQWVVPRNILAYCEVATSCCISDEPCQQEKANFDLPHSTAHKLLLLYEPLSVRNFWCDITDTMIQVNSPLYGLINIYKHIHISLPAKQTVVNRVQWTVRQVYETFRLWTLQYARHIINYWQFKADRSSVSCHLCNDQQSLCGKTDG